MIKLNKTSYVWQHVWLPGRPIAQHVLDKESVDRELSQWQVVLNSKLFS